MTCRARSAGFQPREPLLAFAAAVAALLAASPGAAQAPPLEEVAGRLLAAPAPLDVGAETIGSFQLEAASSGEDLRTAPGSAVLEMFDGRITGSAVRVNEVRNVDPATGRPRSSMSTGGCDSDVVNPGVSRQDPGYIVTDPDPDCLTPGGAVDQNLQAFADICSFTRGFTGLDRTRCALDIYSSLGNLLVGGTLVVDPISQPSVAALLSNLLAGNSNAGSIAVALAGPDFPTTLVPLNVDPCDGFLADCVTTAQGSFPNVVPGHPFTTVPDIDTPHTIFNSGGTPTLNLVLTQQQKALAGCGQFYGSNCEIDGIRLDQAEAGALLGSFVFGDADTFANVPQPGTVGAAPVPGAMRPSGDETVVLPGARRPGDPGYDPTVDGANAGLLHPFTNQQFSSELAALSWNYLMTAVALSLPDADGEIEPGEFDQANPFRTDGCSFTRPGLCSAVIALELLTTTERGDDPSGAPRLRWVWETGAEYAIDEATGAASPWLGGRLHAAGPEVARVPGEPTGVGFFATLPDDFDPMGQMLPAPLFLARFAGPDGILGTEDDGILGLTYGVASACGNGEDDDGDGLFDVDDPGCPIALAEPEDPSCDDGEDNDSNGLTDFDDPKCTPAFPYGERAPCGLGAELALLLLPWLWRARRRSRRAGQPVA